MEWNLRAVNKTEMQKIIQFLKNLQFFPLLFLIAEQFYVFKSKIVKIY